MKPRCCNYCGQVLPETRLGVTLTPFKARIYDIIQRAGIDGISTRDLYDMIYQDGQSKETLKAHVWQINDLIRDEGYNISGSDGYYRLRQVAASEFRET